MTFIDRNLELLRKLWCKVRGKPYYRREKMHLRLFCDGHEIPVVKVTTEGPPAHPMGCTFRLQEPLEVIRSEKWQK
jgi:hypothetical protein